jgi:Fur family ferric uptake transcriptional regulator
MDESAVLESYLKERGRKMTDPRRIVLKAFLGLERHVTAEELHAAALRLDPGIGQATVFRAVKLFVDAGLAREARQADGGRQYEHAYRHEHHDHLICVDCGLVVEFRNEAVERAQEAIYRANGFVPSGHRLELLGRCPACAGKKKARSRAKAKAGRG